MWLRCTGASEDPSPHLPARQLPQPFPHTCPQSVSIAADSPSVIDSPVTTYTLLAKELAASSDGPMRPIAIVHMIDIRYLCKMKASLAFVSQGNMRGMNVFALTCGARAS